MGRKQLRERVRRVITGHRNLSGGIAPDVVVALTEDLLDIVEEAAGMAPPEELFYSISMRWGAFILSETALITPEPGQTRRDLFTSLQQKLFERYREQGWAVPAVATAESGVILHFSLEPNSLTEG